MALSPTVVDSLRLTPAGNLQYNTDRNTKIETMLGDLTRRMNSLSFARSSSAQITSSPERDIEEETSPVTRVDSKQTRADYLIDENPADDLIKLSLEQLELNRKQTVHELVLQRKARQDDYCRELETDAQIRLQEWQREQKMLKSQQQENQRSEVEARKLQMLQKLQNQKEKNEHYNKEITVKIKEKEIKQKQLEQRHAEKLLAIKRQKGLTDALLSCQKQLNERSARILVTLKNCAGKRFLPPHFKELVQKQHHLSEAMNQVIAEAKERQVVDQDLHTALNLLQQVDENLKDIIREVEIANTSAIAATTAGDEGPVIIPQVAVPFAASTQQSTSFTNIPHAKLEQPITLFPTQGFAGHGMETAIQPIAVTTVSDTSGIKVDTGLEMDVASVVVPSENEADDLSGIYRCISRAALKEYVKLENLAAQYKQGYAKLLEDTSPRIKHYKFQLQKAITVPMNAISAQSGTHLKDKLVRLRHLLQGQNVDVNNARVSVNEHPLAQPMCKDLMAKKFIEKGEERAEHASAFSMAAIVIILWAEIPHFGDLFLAHLSKKCPYTVPYYVPKEEGQPEEEYYKSQGYNYPKGKLEKQEKFLQRMSGMMRLYAAVMCSPVPRIVSYAHPHGIENGWKWLTRILNLEPRPDITATIILDFLETAGHCMQQTYGKQFQKLLEILYKDYFQKIRQVDTGVDNGPLARLETFLEKCLIHKKIPAPEGMLSNMFWHT